jgi:hypothetical protein
MGTLLPYRTRHGNLRVALRSKSGWLQHWVIYHPGMNRPILVVWVVFSAAVTSVVGAGVARAEPPPPCSYVLSSPEVVQVSGGTMVTATVAPGACGAIPFLSVACLQEGNRGAQCTQAHGSDIAQVYAPYHPGATYSSSGRGLASWNAQWPATPDWQLLGPYIATL